MTDLEPLYIDGLAGRLFLMHYPAAAPASAPGECVLVVPAFAEEMNKSRRQLALTARALARRGVAVLIPDLSGTGDSEGTLAHASLDLWLDDLTRAARLMSDRGYSVRCLLGVRSGALLAAPLCTRLGSAVEQIILWQPHTAGKMLINQFLRLRVAAGLMGAADGPTVKDLRASLAAGQPVEVAGYELSPQLVADFDALGLDALSELPPRRIDWLSLGRGDDALPPVTRRMTETLQKAAFSIHHRQVRGDPFWSTAEIATVPALIEATTEALT